LIKLLNVSLSAPSPSRTRSTPDFFDQDYENAQARELTKAGLMVRQQIAIEVLDS
jgi:hypothetical protein